MQRVDLGQYDGFFFENLAVVQTARIPMNVLSISYLNQTRIVRLIRAVAGTVTTADGAKWSPVSEVDIATDEQITEMTSNTAVLSVLGGKKLMDARRAGQTDLDAGTENEKFPSVAGVTRQIRFAKPHRSIFGPYVTSSGQEVSLDVPEWVAEIEFRFYNVKSTTNARHGVQVADSTGFITDGYGSRDPDGSRSDALGIFGSSSTDTRTGAGRLRRVSRGGTNFSWHWSGSNMASGNGGGVFAGLTPPLSGRLEKVRYMIPSGLFDGGNLWVEFMA